jgi:hypothetical protein
MVLEFKIVDKNIYQLNRGNKEVIERNSKGGGLIITNAYVSEKTEDTISRIVKKIRKFMDTDVLLRKKIEGNTCEVPPMEVIEIIDNVFLEVEENITSETTQEEVMGMLTNLGRHQMN